MAGSNEQDLPGTVRCSAADRVPGKMPGMLAAHGSQAAFFRKRCLLTGACRASLRPEI